MLTDIIPVLFIFVFFSWWGMYKGMVSQLNADGKAKFSKLGTDWWQRLLIMVLAFGGFFLQFAVNQSMHLAFHTAWVAIVIALAMAYRQKNLKRWVQAGLHPDFVLKAVNAVLIMQIALVLILVSLPMSLLSHI